MNIISKIPGPLLIFLGAFCLSFGGLIVKSFEGANLWQILFWRQIFFSIIIIFYLIFTYKKNFFKSFYTSGIPGFLGGLVLAIGFAAYVFAMYKTTVANTNFIITTETIFLAAFGYFFLKERVDAITLVSIIVGMSGVLLIINNSLSIQSGEQFFGNIIAFIMPISFAVLVLIVRKYPNVDMIPAQFTAGITAALIGFFMAGKILISFHDLFLAFLSGFFQIGFGFIFITIGSKSTPAAIVGVIMLIEAVLGPLWAWMFVNENPPMMVLIGGITVITAVLIQFFSAIKSGTFK
jgi:drug/metabolite transporter (DMT)-like permease